MTNFIDAQLNLVKNGAVTEKCFPYKSGDGKTIPKCPSKCEDGSEFKKYYAQNAFTFYSYYRKFNNQVILVMDQLVTKGPVAASFYLYENFRNFSAVKENCLNKVYTHEEGTYKGEHYVTVVGYGVFDNKIYWLLQNSQGKDWCDGGLIKMEIGQLVEITFSQPLDLSGSKAPVEIDVEFSSQNKDCNFEVLRPSNIHDWNNTVFVHFEHESSKSDILTFQIGNNKLLL